MSDAQTYISEQFLEDSSRCHLYYIHIYITDAFISSFRGGDSTWSEASRSLLTSAAECPSLLVTRTAAGDCLPLVSQAALHATDAVLAGAVDGWPSLEGQMTVHAADADAGTAGAALTQNHQA